MDVFTLVDRTFRELRQRGWNQGEFLGPWGGGLCLRGAICVARYGDPETAEEQNWDIMSENYSEAHIELIKRLAEKVGPKWLGQDRYTVQRWVELDPAALVSHYNDLPTTTQADIEQLLHEVAADIAAENDLPMPEFTTQEVTV